MESAMFIVPHFCSCRAINLPSDIDILLLNVTKLDNYGAAGDSRGDS